MGTLGQEGRGVSWVEEFTKQGRGSVPGLAGPPHPAWVGGQGTSHKESYPVLCLVSLGHRSGKEVFKDSHDWSLT